MSFANAWELFSHFLALSLLAIGGAITTAPDMHRYLVDEMNWLSDPQFSASIAIAQGAPGPNVLFVSLLGWQVGANLGQATQQWWAGLLGMLIAMLGIMLPSSILTLSIARKLYKHSQDIGVRAFKAGLAPIAIALLFSTAWILASATKNWHIDWRLWLLTAFSLLTVYFLPRLHLLFVLGFGALLGALGWV